MEVSFNTIACLDKHMLLPKVYEVTASQPCANESCQPCANQIIQGLGYPLTSPSRLLWDFNVWLAQDDGTMSLIKEPQGGKSPSVCPKATVCRSAGKANCVPKELNQAHYCFSALVLARVSQT